MPVYTFCSLTNVPPCTVVMSVSGYVCGLWVCVYGCVWAGGFKTACMRLCTVWPLSVKVESSAEAYGKP